MYIRNRFFSQDDIDKICRAVGEHFDKGRLRIAEIICDELNWRQQDGKPKTRSGYDVLIKLSELGILELPAPRTKPGARPRKTVIKYLKSYDLSSPIETFHHVQLEVAQTQVEKRLWGEIISSYHYIGTPTLVGRNIKYLIKLENILIGALSFSSPAWKLEARDRLLRTIGMASEEILEKTINNSRFLILPNVHVPNLASNILAMAVRRIVIDWAEVYSITPLVAETFVQPSLYKGTCYKAANWLEIGVTKGYAKKGTSHHNSQEPKRILLYGLNKELRQEISRVNKLG